MATLTAVVLDHHKKSNQTFNVKIRVGQKGESAYIPTTVFADKRYIDTKGKLKQAFIDKKVSDILDRYNDHLTESISRHYSAQRIKEYLLEKDAEFFAEKVTAADIDFISFCQKYVDNLRDKGKENSATPLQTVTNSLNDYFASRLSPDMITSRVLCEYEEYLRDDRVLIRVNQFQRKVTTKSKGLSDAGVFKHMANLRLLFNACKLKYNDEDIGKVVIANNPFVKYKLKPARNKKKRNSEIDVLIILYNSTPTSKRERQAKDLFFISFFLCGINAVDIYNNNMVIEKGRLSYCRSKTTERRSDDAFISIAVPKAIEASLLEYIGKPKVKYYNSNSFNKALNTGLKSLCGSVGLDGDLPTFYSARHSFATIARNNCRCSKDDVADALNHVDNGMSVTDGYLAKDWSIVDEVQSKVLKFFFDKIENAL